MINMEIRFVWRNIQTDEIKMFEVEVIDLAFGNPICDEFNENDMWILESTDCYIGQKDEHGKKIFENDITHHGIVVYEVGEDESEFKFMDFERWEYHSTGYLTTPIEVLGNTHENPELVEKLRAKYRCD